YLLTLADAVPRWIASMPKDVPQRRMPPDWQKMLATEGYADLMVAFGLASLGESNAARRLLDRGRSILADRDAVHSALLRAFTYRIEQALAGRPHAGPLPVELLQDFDQLPDEDRYRVDRLCYCSRVLEPLCEVNPFARITRLLSEVTRALADL